MAYGETRIQPVLDKGGNLYGEWGDWGPERLNGMPVARNMWQKVDGKIVFYKIDASSKQQFLM